MTDPKRLFDTEDDPALGAALHAAADDGPPAGTEDRMLAALGLGPAAGAGTTAAVTKTVAKLGLVKWVGVSVVIAAVATGGVLATREEPTQPPPAPSVSAPDPILPVPPIEPPAPVVEAPSAEPPLVRHAAAPHFGVSAPPPSAPPSAAPASSSSLSEELAILAEANAAVRRHDAAAATNALDRYDARFGHGSLADESEALRIDVVAMSDEPRARTMAKSFLTRHPTSPHAHRMRRLAEGGP